jgi:hypothetical protein
MIEDPIPNGKIHFRFRSTGGVFNGFHYELVDAGKPCPNMDL